MALNQQRFITQESKTVIGAFGITKDQFICLVGGGGKTSTMYEIAKDLKINNVRVIATSTTHIQRPTENDIEYVFSKQHGEEINIDELKKAVDQYRSVGLINENGSDRVSGVEVGKLNFLYTQKIADVIICEADGASQCPIKCPKETEPVFTDHTNMVIPVVGMDALYATIGSDKTFRNEYICKVTGLKMGDELDEEAIAEIVTNEHGLIQYAPKDAEIIPFLNKIDITGRKVGIELAKVILAKNHPQIKKVVIGAMHDTLRGFTIVTKL